MTEQDHADLSRRLALALGYYPESVRTYMFMFVEVWRVERKYRGFDHAAAPCRWHAFDYRQPDVALPVLEWLRKGWNGTVGTDARTGNPYVFLWKLHDDYEHISRYRHEADTLEEAIARAAIAAKGVK